jgi:hypothetical protein
MTRTWATTSLRARVTTNLVALVALGGCGGDGAGSDPVPRACDESLKTVDIGADATVTLVKVFRAGDALSLVAPASPNAARAETDVCFVKVLVGPGNPGPSGAPSTSTGIGIEVWLPEPANWNQRYMALGGGGWQGGPDFVSLTAIGSLQGNGQLDPVPAAAEGFVTSATDAGHSIANEGSFAMNPDGSFNEILLRDFAERSLHEMALKTKALAKAYYGSTPKHSYWNGCSTGGRQGLIEVQRHPEDFDGVLAGAPAINWDRFLIADLWPQIVMQQDLGAPIAGAKLAAATAAAIAACGTALTGQADGYISDPSGCRYDPAGDPSLLCVSAGGANDTAACLTLAEAGAIRKIWYGPSIDGTAPDPASDNGYHPRAILAANQLWFGPTRGTLLAGHPFWDGLAGQEAFTIATDQVALALGDSAFAQPNFINASGNGEGRWRNIGYTGPMAFPDVLGSSQQRLGDLLATDDADLTAFRDRGGKLLIWHGTADSLIPAQGSINYYESVVDRMGGYPAAQEFARLYLAPGIDHCYRAAVDGTNPPFPGGREYDPNTPLIKIVQAWVEDGEVPDAIAATSAPGVVPTRIRPWCAYPKKLTYVSGDVNTGTFTCE